MISITALNTLPHVKVSSCEDEDAELHVPTGISRFFDVLAVRVQCRLLPDPCKPFFLLGPMRAHAKPMLSPCQAHAGLRATARGAAGPFSSASSPEDLPRETPAPGDPGKKRPGPRARLADSGGTRQNTTQTGKPSFATNCSNRILSLIEHRKMSSSIAACGSNRQMCSAG